MKDETAYLIALVIRVPRKNKKARRQMERVGKAMANLGQISIDSSHTADLLTNLKAIEQLARRARACS